MRLIKIYFLIVIVFSFKNTFAGVFDSICTSSFLCDTNYTSKPDSIIFKLWDETNNTWINNWKQKIEYNPDRLKQTEIKSYWVDRTWKEFSQVDFIYSNYTIIKQIHSIWDDYEANWLLQDQYAYAYNENGQILQITDKKWLYPDGWVMDTLYVNQYNQEGLLTLENVSIWSPFINDWENYSELQYDYISGVNTRQLFSTWDLFYLSWVPKRMVTKEYNTNKKLIAQTQTIMNPYQTAWLNDKRGEFQYYENGLIREELYWSWSTYDSLWFNEYKINYYYDFNGNCIKKEHFLFDAYYLSWNKQYQTINNYTNTNQLISSTLYYWNYSQWNPLYQFDYYYSDYLSIETQPTENLIHVFPNPTVNVLYVQSERILNGEYAIRLFNLSGKLVYSIQISGIDSQIELPLPYLNSGLYLLEIKVENVSVVKKVLIQH
jgi:hypothetical protein